MNLSLPVQSESELIFTISGIILLLGGWIIFRLGSRLLGVGLGAGFGFFFGEVINILLKIDRQTGLYVTIGCSVVGALAAIFMIRAVTNFLFALIGLLFGALLGRIGAEIYAAVNGAEFVLNSQSAMIIGPTALVTALMAVWLQRLIMILITSYMGATFLVAGVEYLSQQPWAFMAVLVAGIFWQGFVMGRIFKSRPKTEPRRRIAEEG